MHGGGRLGVGLGDIDGGSAALGADGESQLESGHGGLRGRFDTELEFHECHELHAERIESFDEWQLDGDEPDGVTNRHAGMHGAGRLGVGHGEFDSKSATRPGADGESQLESEHDSLWGQLDTKLEFHECHELHAERIESFDEWQLDDDEPDDVTDRHAGMHGIGRFGVGHGDADGDLTVGVIVGGADDEHGRQLHGELERAGVCQCRNPVV